MGCSRSNIVRDAASLTCGSSIAEARIIAYYGIKPLPPPLSIAGTEMDDHFVFPIFRYVEEVNSYFQEQLYGLLRREAGIELEVDKAALCDMCPLHAR